MSTSLEGMKKRQKKLLSDSGCESTEIPSFCCAVEKAFADFEKAGAQPNFLFVGNSVLHIATLNAFLLKLSSQGIKPCGVVCDNIDPSRMPQFGNRDVFAINSEDRVILRRQKDFVFQRRSLLGETIENLFPCIPDQATKSHILEKENPESIFYLLVTNEEYPSRELWKAACSQSLPVRCVLLEEGVGSYVSQKSTHEFFAKKETSRLKRVVKLFKGKIAGPLKRHYRTTVEKKCKIDTFGLLNFSGNGLRPNSDYCYWIKKTLKKQGKIRGIADKDFSNQVIIVGTNFEELGSAKTEKLLLEKIVKVVEGCGFKPYFRPHPRTKNLAQYKYLNIEVDSNAQCPLEALIASASSMPVAIVGLGSSSQLLGNVLWEIPAITVASLLEEVVLKGDAHSSTIKAFVARIRMFDKTFQKWFIPVKDCYDLELYLGKCLKGPC